MRHVEQTGHNRSPTFGEALRVVVRLDGGIVQILARHAEGRRAVGRGDAVELPDPPSVGLTADGEALDVGRVGDVEVEVCAVRQAVPEQVFGHALGESDSLGEVGLAAIVHQGDAERGDVEHAAFDGGADGSGVVYAEGLVAAVVDARDEQVGLAVEHFADGQLHAVGRCARATADGHALRFGEHPVGDGLCGGDGGRHARAGPIGGHDEDVAQQAHAFGQCMDTARIDAVVVRYQYQGSLIHLFCHSFN